MSHKVNLCVRMNNDKIKVWKDMCCSFSGGSDSKLPLLLIRCFPSPCPFLIAAALKLHQVGWEASVHSHFQISPETFNQIQVWAVAGPLKDIHIVVLKPLLWYLGCVLRIVVLLKDEPSPPGQERSGAGFHPECLCTLLHSSFPLSWLVSQFLPLKNIPTAWCCHHASL